MLIRLISSTLDSMYRHINTHMFEYIYGESVHIVDRNACECVVWALIHHSHTPSDIELGTHTGTATLERCLPSFSDCFLAYWSR